MAGKNMFFFSLVNFEVLAYMSSITCLLSNFFRSLFYVLGSRSSVDCAVSAFEYLHLLQFLHSF